MSTETKYNSDKADPQINFNSLDDAFNIDNSIDTQIEEVKSMKQELKKLEDDLPDADQIILDNIERANEILDKVQTAIINGDTSARLIEVAAQLINAVTSAATAITGIGYNQQVIDNKNRALDIKEKEIGVKMAMGQVPAGTKEVNITNNNLMMNREDLLKLMNEG